MLSGISTQSPVSSVFSMPQGSLPMASSMAATTMATSLAAGAALPDSFFLGAVPPVGSHDLEPLKTELPSKLSVLVSSCLRNLIKLV